LNVQVLFESDLGRLSPGEQEALRAIARAAPVLVSELEEEAISSAVLESLLHQRLVVQVGERLDVYWDTFRDFLNTGRVAIEDSYVIRYAPMGAGRLLRVVMAARGDIAVPDAAEKLNTSATVIFNYARELRLFGVLAAESNRLVVEPEVLDALDREEAIRARVLLALRRHKMHTIALDLIGSAGGTVSISSFAQALPPAFPTVEAKADSWFTYARSFCQWMEYAGIVELGYGGMVRRPEDADGPDGRLLSGAVPVRVRSAFPGASPGPALQLLRHLAAPTLIERPSQNTFSAALRDLSLLGAVELDAGDHIALAIDDLVIGEAVDQTKLRSLVEQQRGMADALETLERDPSASPKSLGEAHREALGAQWVDSTAFSVGKFIRGWARACGVTTRLRPDASIDPDAATLWDAGIPGITR
jgi:hypothetical protein